MISMTILYPIAETAEAALHAPRGFAAREREAAALAGGQIAFATEAVGPAFVSEDAALEAYVARSDDERWRQLRPVSVEPGAKPPIRAPLKPTFRDGRRWPEAAPLPAARTLWRLSVSYWKILASQAAPIEAPARKLRRDGAARDLDLRALDALSRQPLRPALPQRPLDIGLFEVRLPESPDIIVPDD